MNIIRLIIGQIMSCLGVKSTIIVEREFIMPSVSLENLLEDHTIDGKKLKYVERLQVLDNLLKAIGGDDALKDQTKFAISQFEIDDEYTVSVLAQESLENKESPRKMMNLAEIFRRLAPESYRVHAFLQADKKIEDDEALIKFRKLFENIIMPIASRKENAPLRHKGFFNLADERETTGLNNIAHLAFGDRVPKAMRKDLAAAPEKDYLPVPIRYFMTAAGTYMSDVSNDDSNIMDMLFHSSSMDNIQTFYLREIQTYREAYDIDVKTVNKTFQENQRALTNMKYSNEAQSKITIPYGAAMAFLFSQQIEKSDQRLIYLVFNAESDDVLKDIVVDKTKRNKNTNSPGHKVKIKQLAMKIRALAPGRAQEVAKLYKQKNKNEAKTAKEELKNDYKAASTTPALLVN